MQTVTPGASHLEVTPIAYGTWQIGGDWESVGDQAAVAGLVREGLTRHVGVSNYSTDQITAFAAVWPAETVQPPYHLLRRDIETDLLPYARTHHIGVLAYGPLAHGLLGGTITEATTVGGDDWRSHSPACRNRVLSGPHPPIAVLPLGRSHRRGRTPVSRVNPRIAATTPDGCWKGRPS